MIIWRKSKLLAITICQSALLQLKTYRPQHWLSSNKANQLKNDGLLFTNLASVNISKI